MLSIEPPATIYLHSGTTDMRKSFDGLSEISDDWETERAYLNMEAR